MKYLVFSDVHGNQYALKQMLCDVQNKEIDGYIFLGDICGYYYGQNECLDLLRGLDNAFLIKGNHDRYYINMLESRDRLSKLVDAYGNSYMQCLGLENLKYLNCFSERLKLCIDGKRILCVHGGLHNSFEERIYPDSAWEYMNRYCQLFDAYDYVFTGHTHYSFYKKQRKTVWVNPGSVGQPRDGLGAKYCIVDFSNDRCQFYEIIYDKKVLTEEILQNHESQKNQDYLINILYRERRG